MTANVTVQVPFPASVNATLTSTGPRGAHAERTGCVAVSPSEAVYGELTAGTSKAVIRINPELNGMVLYVVGAGLATPAASGVVSVQYRRVRAGVSVNMLSTPITIDQGEYDSVTAATPAVIATANASVQTGDQIHFDVVNAGSGAYGLICSFSFRPA